MEGGGTHNARTRHQPFAHLTQNPLSFLWHPWPEQCSCSLARADSFARPSAHFSCALFFPMLAQDLFHQATGIRAPDEPAPGQFIPFSSAATFQDYRDYSPTLNVQ